MEATNLLANMLGFTRHERLDVKKPGPPAAPPPSSQSPHEPPKLDTAPSHPSAAVNKEVIPTHMKGLLFNFFQIDELQFKESSLILQTIYHQRSKNFYIPMQIMVNIPLTQSTPMSS